jgi:alpha-L-fucosidase
VINFESEKNLNHVVIQEDIKHGERVRTYTVKGLKDGQWQEICSGQCIGHKRIQQFETDQYSGVKLTIDESLAEPRIRNFSVFHVG